jgi:hypothetical protein
MTETEAIFYGRMVIFGGFLIFLHTIDRFYQNIYKENDKN